MCGSHIIITNVDSLYLGCSSIKHSAGIPNLAVLAGSFQDPNKSLCSVHLLKE